MRSIIPSSVPSRLAVAILATICVASLFQAATARDDLGLHLFWSEQVPSASARQQVAVPPLLIQPPKAARPLRVGLMKRHEGHTARPRQHGSLMAQSVPSRLLSLPVPTKPAIVSIYEDRTLRNGDAVMLADGIHVFRGDSAGLHRPHDFVRLQRVASLAWKLRQTLNDLDRNPPTRWTSLTSTPS